MTLQTTCSVFDELSTIGLKKQRLFDTRGFYV